MQRILVGVDGSDASTKAAQFAAEIATRFGARLTLAYAIPRLVLPPDAYGLSVADVDEEHRAFAEKLLAHALARAGEGDVRADTVVLDGPAAETLAEAAQEKDVDLVVVGSHGRGAVARMLLGSVSDRLVHICPKPVLVVR
jgi:nucleotide-binding universal stress UspA family protein